MVRRLEAMLIAASLAGSLAAAAPADAHDGWGHHGGRHTLWASPFGGSGSCSRRDPCSLQNAVSSAAPGAKVVALPGVYEGGVVVDARVRLEGWGAVIDASSSPNGNGVQIAGPDGSGSSVEGFKIENAKFEGILVGTAPVDPSTTDGTPATAGEPVSDVRIDHNVVVSNDTGFGSTAGQCFTTPNAPAIVARRSISCRSPTRWWRTTTWSITRAGSC